jgi:hypothetical protein
MDLTLAKEMVLKSENINDLYDTEVKLTEYSGELHNCIGVAEFPADRNRYKTTLTMVTTLLGICRERQTEVRDQTNRFNYNFRMAAETILSSTTYKYISDKAKMPRYQFKAEAAELRKNKLST